MKKMLSPAASEGQYEKLYHMLLGNIPFSLLLINPALRVVLANRNFIEKAKRTEENTVGKRIGEVFPAAILEFTQLETKIRSVFKTGLEPPGAQMIYRAPGVPTRTYFYTVVPIKSGAVVEQAMLVLDDISEQLELSAKVRMAERHLGSVLESVNDMVISTDTQGLVTSWNLAAERLSGYRGAAIMGRRLVELCEITRRSDMEVIIGQLATGGVVDFVEELDLIKQDGASLPVSWSFARIRDDSGQVSGIVAVVRDLSQRQALERQLRQREKMAALGVMANGVAHELRNPLSVSFSAAQFLLDPTQDPAFRKECVGKIVQGIERACTIIDNLLRFCSPSSGDQVETLNLVTVVRDALDLLRSQAQSKKIVLSEQYTQTQLPITGNADLLYQVITNLVMNAYQALPDGGEVSVLTCAEADQAAVYVRDNGSGMESTHLSQIFDPFFTIRALDKGMGLGLSICHTIVKQHGGIIAVENNVEGHGSTMVLRLPLLPANS
ncbi:MAG: ATP-binding protein [Comamonadaceae bacterium]